MFLYPILSIIVYTITKFPLKLRHIIGFKRSSNCMISIVDQNVDGTVY